MKYSHADEVPLAADSSASRIQDPATHSSSSHAREYIEQYVSRRQPGRSLRSSEHTLINYTNKVPVVKIQSQMLYVAIGVYDCSLPSAVQTDRVNLVLIVVREVKFVFCWVNSKSISKSSYKKHTKNITPKYCFFDSDLYIHYYYYWWW